MKLDLKENLARLAELTDEQLDAFNVEIIAALAELSESEDSAAGIGELTALGLASDAVRRQFDSRQRTALAASAAPAASGGQLARMAAQGHPSPSPEVRAAQRRGHASLIASASMRGVDAGQAFNDQYELGRAMAETLNRMSKAGPPRGDVVLASAKWSYPEDRRLTDDSEHNARIFDAVCSPQALVATGGICLPTNVDFSVPVWATAERPLRDGLPGFEATRGGIRYVSAPDIGTWAAATGIWTEATDASPGAATKPVASLSCGTEQLVYVQAVSTRIGFGNMQSRFAPEQIAANTDLAFAAAARVAENSLLGLIAAQCIGSGTTGVTTGTGVGIVATRDLITAINQACAAYRNLHRLPSDAVLTAIFPDWVKDLIRIDLAREIGHGQEANGWNSFAVTDTQIEDMLSASKIKCIFHLDGQSSSVAGGVAQAFATQSTGAVNTFPSKMVWYAFPEGAIQFLDGGRLDLGVVRDSTLDATNDFEVFVEVLESVAFRSFTGGALQLVSTLCANGTSAGTADTHGTCA
jgi:hypothetical protein